MLHQSSAPQKPAAWNWYAAYCVLMALLYLFCIAAGFFALLADEAKAEMGKPEAKIMGAIFIGVGLTLLIPFAAGPLLPRRRWAWVVGLVLICIGLTSACCLPAAIPLLIWWLKPEMKEYYSEGRSL